jgi:hypothetical protein
MPLAIVFTLGKMVQCTAEEPQGTDGVQTEHFETMQNCGGRGDSICTTAVQLPSQFVMIQYHVPLIRAFRGSTALARGLGCSAERTEVHPTEQTEVLAKLLAKLQKTKPTN